MVTQKGFVQPATTVATHDIDLLAGARYLFQWVAARVIHGGRRRHRAGIKRLDLVGTKSMAFEPHGQMHHVLITGSWMCRDKVRHQKLLFASLLTELVEQLLELVVAPDARLHHLGQRPDLGMLRRDFQVATDVVGNQLLDILGRLDRKVIAQPRTDQDFFHALQCTGTSIHMDQRAVIRIQVLTDVGIDTAGLAAGRLDLGALAPNAIHVGGRSAQIGNDASKSRYLVAYLLDFTDDGVLASALDDAPLVLGNRAECASSKTATHDVDTETDHLPGRDLGLAIVTAVFIRVNRMRTTGIGQVKHQVHFGSGQRNGRWVDPHITCGASITVCLDKRTRIARIGFQMQHTVGVRVQDGIRFDLLIRWKSDHASITRRNLELALGLKRGIRRKSQGNFVFL